MVLAARLKNKEFKEWVSHELKGYKEGDDLPDYRSIDVASYGDFFDVFGNGPYKNYPIPTYPLPDEFRKYATTMSFSDPISALDNLIKNNAEGFVQFPWPPEVVQVVGTSLYSDKYCITAWKLIHNHTIFSIIDTVRTRILEFVLEIETVDPSAGDTHPSSQPIAPEHVRQIFYTVIMGDVGNLAPGGSDITQLNYQEVHKGDLESLKEYLLNLGIGIQHSDVQELESALSDDQIEDNQNKIGNRTKRWIESAKNKASTGAGGVSVGVMTDLIVKGISMYLGLPA